MKIPGSFSQTKNVNKAPILITVPSLTAFYKIMLKIHKTYTTQYNTASLNKLPTALASGTSHGWN
jgi:hypothetical protein